MRLEQLVRTFQSPLYFPAAQPSSVQLNVPKTVLLSVGKKGGQIKVLEGGFSNTETKFMDTKSKTYTLRSVTKRLYNPDDPSQYVDHEMSEKEGTKAGGGMDFERITNSLKGLIEAMTKHQEVLQRKQYNPPEFPQGGA